MIDGKPVSKNKVFQYRDAIFKALYTDLKRILPWLLTEKKTVTGEEPSLAIVG